MKLNRSKLRRLIKEEYQTVLKESNDYHGTDEMETIFYALSSLKSGLQNEFDSINIHFDNTESEWSGQEKNMKIKDMIMARIKLLEKIMSTLSGTSYWQIGTNPDGFTLENTDTDVSELPSY